MNEHLFFYSKVGATNKTIGRNTLLALYLIFVEKSLVSCSNTAHSSVLLQLLVKILVARAINKKILSLSETRQKVSY